MLKTLSIWVWVLLLSLALLSACATNDVARQVAKERVVWPPPPFNPKFEFSKIVYSNQEFIKSVLQKKLEDPRPLFEKPFSVINKNGKTYLTDLKFPGYIVVDIDNKKLFHKRLGDKLIPCGIDVDDGGNVYVSDLLSKKVIKATGDSIIPFESHPELLNPTYLKIDNLRQRLYVSDPQSHKIYTYSLDGKFLHTIGEQGIAEGKFTVPQGLDIDLNGNLYVADTFNSRVQVFSPDREFIRTIGWPGLDDDGLERPRDVAIGTDQLVYIADYAKGKIMVFNLDGEMKYSLGSSKKTSHVLGFATPTSLTVEGGKLIVADKINRRLSIWNLL